MLSTQENYCDRCVCCGEPVPEGRMVCYCCEHGNGPSAASWLARRLASQKNKAAQQEVESE